MFSTREHACKRAWQVKRSGHCNGGVTAIRCGGQQLGSAGVRLVMGAIFHKALLVLGARGWGSELHRMAFGCV